MALEMVIEKLDAMTAVATISGPLTLGTNLKTVDNNLQTLIAGGVKRLVLDLSGCSYADSSGLGLLMMVNGIASKSGGALRLCALSSRVADLIQLTHTESILKCDADRSLSLAALDAQSR
jgi:anti-sigma B factor antagonist